MSNKRIDLNSLSHSKWNCKYHIVFAPKYRRMIIYGKIVNVNIKMNIFSNLIMQKNLHFYIVIHHRF